MTRPCRLCKTPTTRGHYCDRCFAEVFPHAAARSLDTRHARSMDQLNEAYDKARQVDEADASPKRERWER